MAKRYNPPEESLDALASIKCLLHHPKVKEVKNGLDGQTFMCELPGGQLYYESQLQVDSDGSIFAKQDKTGAGPTSIRHADGTELDANTVNYFVLPKGGFDKKHNIKDGDFGVVIRGSKVAYACYGDRGQNGKLGEGSIALLRELGHETVSRGKFINDGIDEGVITIVFPGSGNGFGQLTFRSRQAGPPLFEKLKEEGLAYEREILKKYRWRDLPLKETVDRDDLIAKLSDWMQEVLDELPHAPGTDGDGEELVNTADGIETLMYAPVTMAMPDGKGYNTRTVYADFKMGDTPGTKYYIKKVVFHLNPRDQAAAERERVRSKY